MASAERFAARGAGPTAHQEPDRLGLRVRLLGGLSVDGLSDRDLGSRKGRTLLKLLALRHGTPVPVDVIAEVLWGEGQPARPAEQVGVLVSRLRRVLGPASISRDGRGYALRADWVDVDSLRELTHAASLALAEGRAGAARVAADAALRLVQGPLLGDEEGAWLEVDRAAVAATVTAARRVAVDGAAAAGDLAAAVMLAEQVLGDDPYDEAALRSLMRAHMAAGRPASALAAYARVRARLADDLGASPAVETEAVHRAALAAGSGDAPAAPDRDTGAATRDRAELVGRDEELVALDRALDAVTDGGASLVVVEGAAGMGKTALVEAWGHHARERALVLHGRCDELGRDLPLQPVADALAQRLRTAPGDTASVLGADAAVLAPFVGPAAPATSATVIADPEAGRLRVFASLAAAVGRAGDGAPVVLVVEDLHWADPATRSWLGYARRRCSRLLLVATTRPVGDDRLTADARLRLTPLSPANVRSLVGPSRAEELYERTGGHPLLVAAFAHVTEGDRPASTVRAGAAAQLAVLGESAADTVRTAAVLGVDCDVDLVAQLRQMPAAEVVGHLEAAVAAWLVVERGHRLAFRHELVREAVAETLGAPRRALIHRSAARALAARPAADMLAVAVHAREGGDHALAATSLVRAAEAAVARSDLEAAERHLDEAIRTAPTADAHVVRAQLLMSRLALPEARDEASRAVALGGGARALEVAGWVAYYQRRYQEAEAYAVEALARAGDDGPLRVSARALAGRVRHGSGDVAGAVACLEHQEDAPLSVRGVADVWLAQARIHQGRPQDALAALSRPMVDPDSLAHPWAPLHLRFNRILALGQLGRAQEALEVAADLDRATRRGGPVAVKFVAPAANATAWVLRWTGRLEEADERNLHAVEVTGGSTGPDEQFAEGHYVALLDLADGCLIRGDVAAAGALVDRLAPVDEWRGSMAWHQRHRLGLVRARIALASGDRADAAALASTVADDAAARGASRYEMLALAVLGLADPAVPVARLAPVVDGLGRCAALDGWWLVAALGQTRSVDLWRREAERRASAVVAAAGERREPAAGLVDRLLTASRRR